MTGVESEHNEGTPKGVRRSGGRPLVSFFVAGRNVQDYVEEAIRSMLAQTVDDFELLILDDGSTDKTYDVMMSVQDHRIRVLRNETCLGIARSLNRLMEHCQGRFWAHMDADDICAPERLEKQLEIMQADKSIGICGCRFVAFYPSGEARLFNPPLEPEKIKASLLFTAPMAHPFVTFNGDFFAKHGIKYSEKMVCALDYELYIKIFLQHPHVDFVNADHILGFYRRHEGQISTARSQEQLHYTFRAQMQVFQALGIAPGNKLMRFHQNLYAGLAPTTADDMAGLVDWAVTLRMANASKRLFDISLFDGLLYARLEAIMQHSPSLSERHLWRLKNW